MKRIIAFIPLILLAIVGLFFAYGLTQDPRQLPAAMVDRPMPDFNLPALFEGQPKFSNQDLADKVTMVNVFASWCVACRIEHPTLMRLAQEDAVPIYGVDWKDEREDGQNWLNNFGNPYIHTGMDARSKLAIELGVTGAPETYIIDRTGRIRYKQIGPITDEVWTRDIEPLIKQLEQEE